VSAEASVPLSLDVVRARIFYLACDVEPVSPPAAMLLRAVADAIDEDAGAHAAAPAVEGPLASAFAELSKLAASVGVGGGTEPPLGALTRLSFAKHRP
jgi:hypothetical protein